VTARKLQEVEKKAAEFQEQVDTVKKAETDLELALTRCHEHRDELVQKNLDAREKVSESLQLVECALAEKNVALFSEAQTKGKNISNGNKIVSDHYTVIFSVQKDYKNSFLDDFS
jgi:uncharacterized protein YqfA (UPF0365 family)